MSFYRKRFYELVEFYERIGFPNPYKSALTIYRHNGRMAATHRRGRKIKILSPKIYR